MRYQDLPLIGKVLSVLLLMSIIAFGVLTMATRSMSSINDAYGRLLDGEETGARLFVAANRELAWTERSIIQLIWSTDDTMNARFLKETNDAAQHFKDFLAATAKAVPKQSREINAISDRFAATFDRECQTAIKMGAASTTLEGNAKAMAVMNQGCAANMADLSRDVVAFADRLAKESDQATHNLDREVSDTVYSTFGIGLAGMVAVLLVAFIATRSGIVRPLKSQLEVMGALAQGNHACKIVGVDRKDEVGEIARAVQVFKDNAVAMEQMRSDQDRQKKQAEEDKRRTMNSLADQFENSVKGIVSTVSSSSHQLQGTAQHMSANAEQTNRQCTTVAAAAEQASVNVQTVASATEELAASISEISRQVSESTKIAGAAVEEANRTNNTVAGLQEAAQKIGEVVNLINNIASQTNLLALNATIEAARAGDAGKGFAVVASEVKNLANQTAKATDDIQAQVGQMQSVTGTTVDAIRSITGTIQRMSEISTAIASAVEEQGAATQEISRNVQQASRGTHEVSSNIQSVVGAARETGQGASQTLGAANNLSTAAESLSREVDRFIGTIRKG